MGWAHTTSFLTTKEDKPSYTNQKMLRYIEELSRDWIEGKSEIEMGRSRLLLGSRVGFTW